MQYLKFFSILISSLLVVLIFFNTIIKENGIIKKNINADNIVSKQKLNLPNPHNFDFVINPMFETCKDNPVVVAYLFCKPDDFQTRMIRRNTWADISKYKDFKILFALGLSKNETINQKIKEESKIYNDIIQEDFIDSYYNLTKKLMMSLKWASMYCKSAQFFLRINDDVVVNTPHLLEYLKDLKSKSPDLKTTILGELVSNSPVDRGKGSKFYVSHEQYPKDTYELYCSGNAYIFTNDMTGLFFNATLHVHMPPFSEWLEDVYVGIIAKKLNLKWLEIRSKTFYFHSPNTNLNGITKTNTIFVWTHNSKEYFDKAWDKFKPN